ncbi:MAG: hypothetical protein EA405_02705 [Rhodospirillales bacterium]|nr:MAG: hypothetical protein EA405_02705 [Rhodospirillales bacterium]
MPGEPGIVHRHRCILSGFQADHGRGRDRASEAGRSDRFQPQRLKEAPRCTFLGCARVIGRSRLKWRTALEAHTPIAAGAARNGGSGTRTLQQLACALGEPGDRDAILFFAKDGTDRWSFRRLGATVDNLARGLVSDGVSRGDTLAVSASNRPEWIIACFAIWHVGAVVVPLDTQMSDDALGHALADSRVRMVFTQSSEAERIETLAPDGTEVVLLHGERDGLRSWQALLDGDGAEPSPVEADDVATLFYTSGTTGPPKGVPLTHRNLMFQVTTLEAAEVVGADDRVLLPLPLHHVYPFVVGMLTPLAIGIPVLLPRSLTGPQIVEASAGGGATLMIGVPRLYRVLVSGLKGRIDSRGPIGRWLGHATVRLCIWAKRRLGGNWGRRLLKPVHQRFGPNLRVLVSGGAALDPKLAATLEGLGWSVATGYGLTETAPMLTIHLPGAGRLDTAGRPIEGVEIRIDKGAAAELGETAEGLGEVLARGPNVFSGYYHLPDKTEDSFTEDGWFRTGDLGAFDADGYLRLAGRLSTMIVTEGGKNVQPDELEEVYQAEPAIGEIAVFGREGRILGVIVPDADAVPAQDGEAAAEAVRRAVEAASRQLPSYKRLADYAITREALPRTRLGKPRRHLIEQRFDEAKRADQTEAEPADRGPMPVHEMSAEDRSLLEDPAARATWDWLKERFPDRRLTPDTDLRLDLEVDSMEWLNIGMDLADRTGVELGEEAIARIERVRDLLEEMSRGGSAEAERREVRQILKDPEAALDDAQKHWLTPLSLWERMLSRVLYGLVWAVMRGPFRLQVAGAERLPGQGPMLIAPNHLSYLDPFAVAVALGHRRLETTWWAGWAGIMFTSRLRRLFSRVSHVVPIDRERAVASSLAFGAAVLNRDQTLVWFPEGQRSPDGNLQAFMPGLGVLLDHIDVPVVPVIIRGTYQAWPRARMLPRIRRLSVTVLDPQAPATLVEAGEGRDAGEKIANALHDRMAAALSGR